MKEKAKSMGLVTASLTRCKSTRGEAVKSECERRREKRGDVKNV